MPLTVTSVAEGLWYWQARNPDTPPGGWPNGAGDVVGSVMVVVADGVALIDPQVPPEAEDRDRLWETLDREVVSRPGGSLAVILTFPGHDRSMRAILDRYAGTAVPSIWIPAGTAAWSPVGHTHAYGRGAALPGGLVPILLDFPGGYPESEAIIAIPAHRAVVLGDAVIGMEAGDPRGPGLRLPPDSTFIGEDDAARAATRAWFGTTLRDAIADVRARFDPETVLVTHGEPLVGTGREGLAALMTDLDRYRPADAGATGRG